jgi:hypothetical protein
MKNLSSFHADWKRSFNPRSSVFYTYIKGNTFMNTDIFGRTLNFKISKRFIYLPVLINNFDMEMSAIGFKSRSAELLLNGEILK